MKKLIALILLLIPCEVSAFSLQQFTGQCGPYRTVIGDTGDDYGVSEPPWYGDDIKLDPQAFRDLSSRGVEFVFFHECGHKVYGDAQAYRGKADPYREHRADCYAAHRFEKKYGRKGLVDVLYELEEANGKIRNMQILSCE